MPTLSFDLATFQDYVAAHGFGDPTGEGIELGKRLLAQGDDYATASFEVVHRGLVHETEGDTSQ